MLPLSRALPLVLLGLFVACSEDGAESSKTSDPPGADRKTVTVSPESGGTLTSADGRLVITIPPGAVASATDLWVESVPKEKAEADFADSIPKGLAYKLGPDGQTFAVPATAVLTLGKSEVPSSPLGMPAMALKSRSKAKGDELLTALPSSAPDGLSSDEPFIKNVTDGGTGAVEIEVALSHFSDVWAEHMGSLWVKYEDTSKPQQKLGDVWSATVVASNQGATTAVVQAAGAYIYGGCDMAKLIPHGSVCAGLKSSCCEQLTDFQVNPAGADILPGSGLSIDPPIQLTCAAAGKADYLVGLNTRVDLSGSTGVNFILSKFQKTVECIDSPLLANGSSCNAGTECASGNCVDGVCCDTTCTGTCKSCKVQGSEGACTNVPKAQSDPATCEYPSACDGAGNCKLTNGSICAGGSSECLSGFCVDLLCCDSDCKGTCMQCDVPGAKGTCTNVPLGGQDIDGCFSPEFCDGKGACKSPDAGTDASLDAGADASLDAGPDGSAGCDGGKCANGIACSGSSQCQSGFCVDGVCCNEICNSQCRACVSAKSKAADGICAAMKNDTDPDNECPGLQTCQGTTMYTAYCYAHLGDPCNADAGNDCPGAGFCRDGVCCDLSSCTVTTTCYACSAKTKGQGLDGYCGPIIAGQDLLNECTVGAGVCNGSGLCM